MLLQLLLHHQQTRRPAHQHDLVDVFRLQTRLGDRLVANLDGALDLVVDELIHVVARQRVGPVDVVVDGDVGGEHRGQVNLGVFALLPQLALVARCDLLEVIIAAHLFVVRVNNVLHDDGVKVASSQELVAAKRDLRELQTLDVHHRHIEGATTQIVDENRLLCCVLCQIRIRIGRGHWFRDNGDGVQSTDVGSITHDLALQLRVSRGHGDDDVRDGESGEGLGHGLQMGQDVR